MNKKICKIPDIEDSQVWAWIFILLILSPQDSYFILIAHWDSRNPCQNEGKKNSLLYVGINKTQPASWIN